MTARTLIHIACCIVTFLCASLVVFLVMRIIPGDPAQIALGTQASPELVAQLQTVFGTDRPLHVQYLDWFGGLLRGDFGTSYVSRQDISPLVIDRGQVSLILVTSALLVALLVAVPLGTMAAVGRRKFWGTGISLIAQLGVAVPGFLAGILLILVFSLTLGWLPSGGWTPPAFGAGEFLSKLILPVLALASVQIAILTRYVRSAVLDVLGEDYIRTARAKGLSKTQTLWHHGMRNAAIPIITVAGVQGATLITGAVVIERVFALPGLGTLLLDAVADRDLLTVQSVVMVLVALTLILNLLIDGLYPIVDPRLRGRART